MINSLVITVLGIASGILIMFRVSARKKITAGTKENIPAVSVIIPARNEEKNIKIILDSIKRQELKPLETIVVDDASTDNTALIARKEGAKVISSGPLPKGWIGKSHACWKGALCAQGEIFIFMDADTVVLSGGFKKIIKLYIKNGMAGLLSIQPYHTIKKIYENLSVIFNIIVMAGINVFTPWGYKLKPAGAFGPCMVCRRQDYFKTGGHSAVKESIMDDLAIGKLFMHKGLPLYCISGKNALTFRMYPNGLGQLIEGWSKNFGTASKSTNKVVFLLIIIWIAAGFSSFINLGSAFIHEDVRKIMIYMLFYLLYAGNLFRMSRKAGNFSIIAVLCYPLLLLFFTGIFIRSLVLTFLKGSVTWKGRSIDTN